MRIINKTIMFIPSLGRGEPVVFPLLGEGKRERVEF
jgi:hypothetical protein